MPLIPATSGATIHHMLPVGRTICVTGSTVVLLSSLFAAGHVSAIDRAYQRDVELWRAEHEKNYRKEYVPLAGLFPLHPGFNTVGSAPGSEIQLPARAPKAFGRFLFDENEKIVRFEPAQGIQATVRGFKVKETAKIR